MNNETQGDSLPGSLAPQTGNLVAGLSQREREVLVLVASGMTNRAISERLVISIGTADRHLHNILAKLGCATRTEAAAFAPLLAATADEPSQAWSPRPKVAASKGNFVGRAPELARLETRLGEAKAGHGGLTMVVGEPGIGKTRLTEEFAGVARRAGFDVLWGRCYEGEWTPP